MLLTSLEVAAEKRGRGGQLPIDCGTCTRCIDACPTNALDVPYQMDATRCIAYLTIEHKGPIAEELCRGSDARSLAATFARMCARGIRNARKRRSSQTRSLRPRPELVNPALEWLGAMDEESFEREFNGSPVRRAGFNGLRRNVAIAMGNSGLRQFVPGSKTWAAAETRACARPRSGRSKGCGANNRSAVDR